MTGQPVDASALQGSAGVALTGATVASAGSDRTAGALGWGGAGLAVLLGAASGGFSGAASMLGLYVLVVGLVALGHRRVRWARLGSRRAGVGALVAALAAMIVAGITTPAPTTASTVRSARPVSQDSSLSTATATTSTASPTPSAPAQGTPASGPAASVPPSVPATSADPVAKAVEQAAAGAALAALGTVVVKGRAPRTGYDRAAFGAAWMDTDRNGCDQRSDILPRDLSGKILRPGTGGCTVLTGRLHDPYTGSDVRFAKSTSSNSAVQIDHVVALANAWVTGAQKWPAAKRTSFANDPLNLFAVGASVNAAKTDVDAATCLPPVTSYRCAYVSRPVAVKAKYGLSRCPSPRGRTRLRPDPHRRGLPAACKASTWGRSAPLKVPVASPIEARPCGAPPRPGTSARGGAPPDRPRDRLTAKQNSKGGLCRGLLSQRQARPRPAGSSTSWGGGGRGQVSRVFRWDGLSGR